MEWVAGCLLWGATLGAAAAAGMFLCMRPWRASVPEGPIQLEHLDDAVCTAGVVEKIQPLRTVIRTDGKVPV